MKNTVVGFIVLVKTEFVKKKLNHINVNSAGRADSYCDARLLHLFDLYTVCLRTLLVVDIVYSDVDY